MLIGAFLIIYISIYKKTEKKRKSYGYPKLQLHNYADICIHKVHLQIGNAYYSQMLILSILSANKRRE